ncbi:MAG: hypothetical protein ACPK85_05860 [Methanosarcina sp.]
MDNLTELYNEIQMISQEIDVNPDYLIPVLQSIDSNLKLVNENLSPHVKEYPFLEPVVTGSAEGMEIVDSMLVFLESNPEKLSENLGNIKITVNLFNETILKVNSHLEYADDQIRVVNSTGEES